MNRFKLGDEIWWFESECGGHWTERFNHEGLELCSGIFNGLNDQGYVMILDSKTEYSGPEKYYKSRDEAINSMIDYLVKMKNSYEG